MDMAVPMPGYQTCEYLLALAPHKDLWDKLKRIRQDFAEEFQSNIVKFADPYLSLASFTTLEMSEVKIINRLAVIASSVAPFTIKLDGFGSLPSHSIFINVKSKLPIQHLVKEIKDMQRLMKLDKDNKPHFFEEPTIIIGRKLKPWQYEKAWLKFQPLNFTAVFIADEVVVLKRKKGIKKWTLLKKFEFLNLKIATKQGYLF